MEFEQHLGRNVLYLACRHHIHEIMLEEAFSITISPSSGPDILLFKRFKAFWPNIDYKPGTDAISGIRPLCRNFSSIEHTLNVK